MDNEKIAVLVVEPEKKPYAKEISSGLSSLQHEVGGYIQAVYPYSRGGIKNGVVLPIISNPHIFSRFPWLIVD